MKRELAIKILSGIMCVLCVAMFFFGGIGAWASKSDDSSVNNCSYYKISTEDAEWKKFQTGDEMRKAVYLDEAVLKDLSTEELLRAVLEYPLICDLYAYDSLKCNERHK